MENTDAKSEVVNAFTLSQMTLKNFSMDKFQAFLKSRVAFEKQLFSELMVKVLTKYLGKKPMMEYQLKSCDLLMVIIMMEELENKIGKSTRKEVELLEAKAALWFVVEFIIASYGLDVNVFGCVEARKIYNAYRNLVAHHVVRISREEYSQAA